MTTSGRSIGQREASTSAYESLTLMTRVELVAQPRSVRPSSQRAGRPIRAMFRASRWMSRAS